MPAESTDRARWREAQEYEQAWWQAREGAVNPEFYRNYARAVREEVSPWITLDEGTRIVEVGSGAAGIVTGLPGERTATDPLENYYGSVPTFVAGRDPAVRYLAAQGEALPLPDGAFDLALCDNVLDHCENPQQVLAEVRRVLRPGGVFWLRVHVYHRWGAFVRHVAERFRVDAGHPHTFTAASLDALVARSGFDVQQRAGTSFAHTWQREVARGLRGSAKDLIKAATFATRRHAVLVLQKPDDA